MMFFMVELLFAQNLNHFKKKTETENRRKMSTNEKPSTL